MPTCTYLVNMPYTDVTGPLAGFQHTLATQEDTHQLTKTINAAIAEGQGPFGVRPRPQEPRSYPRSSRGSRVSALTFSLEAASGVGEVQSRVSWGDCLASVRGW
jgi:hypothetical protein